MCEKLWVPIFFDVCWYWVSWVLNSIDIGLVLNKASIYCLNTRLMLSRKTEPDSRRPGTFVCAKCALYFVTSLSFGGGLAVVVFIPCLVEYAWLCYSVCLFPNSMWFLSLRLASCLHLWAPGVSLLFDRVLRNIVLKSWWEPQERKNTWSELGLFHVSSGLGSWLGDEGHIDLTWLWLWDDPASTRTNNLFLRESSFFGGTLWGKDWWNLRALNVVLIRLAWFARNTWKAHFQGADWLGSASHLLPTHIPTNKKHADTTALLKTSFASRCTSQVALVQVAYQTRTYSPSATN